MKTMLALFWRGVIVAVDCLFLLSLAVLVLAWLLDPLRVILSPLRLTVHWGAKPILAPVLLLIGRVYIAKSKVHSEGSWTNAGLLQHVFIKKLLLAVGGILLPLILFEGILSLIGFSADLPAIVIRSSIYDHRSPKGMGMVSSPEYRWSFKLGGESMGLKINSLGFREREVTPAKRKGTIRVICMGDSCTAQGMPPYSTLLHDLLTKAPPTSNAWESFNMAVIGFSTSQGLRLFQNEVSKLKPDIVTVYFGWNDHWWSGIYQPDSTVMAKPMGILTFKINEILRKKRFYQFVQYYLQPVKCQSLLHTRDRKDCLRVPEEEYVWNLEQLVRGIRRAGAVPILITAPRGRRLSQQLVESGNITSNEDGIQLHDKYAQLTRDVADRDHVFLLDLNRMLSGEECDPLFSQDGIHFTQPGLSLVAQKLLTELLQLVRTQEWSRHRGSEK